MRFMFLIDHIPWIIFMLIAGFFFWIILLEIHCQNLASFPARDLPELNWREIFLQIHAFTSQFDSFHFPSDISDTCSAWHILYPEEPFLQNFCVEYHKHFIRTCGLLCLFERQCNPELHSKLKPECKTAQKSITVILLVKVKLLPGLKAIKFQSYKWTFLHPFIHQSITFGTHLSFQFPKYSVTKYSVTIYLHNI